MGPWVAVIAGVSLAGAGAPSASWLTDDRPDRAQLEATAARVAPMVAAITGRSFTHLPEVVLADPGRLERVLIEEQAHLLRNAGGLSADDARDAARRSAVDLAPTFVGKYGFLDDRLYLVPDGVRRALANEGLPASLLPGVLTLVLAHELTHALQDQQERLEDVVGLRPGDDGVMAVNCLVEGHAVWVHEQVGAALGLDDEVRAVAQILGYDASNDDISGDPDRFYTSYVYGRGRGFVDWHTREKGAEEIWKILRDPPALSAMIVHPERYVGGPAPEPSARIQAALRHGSDRLAQEAWSAEEEAVGDYDVRKRLVHSDAPGELADTIQQAWTARRSNRDVAGAEVEYLRFDSAESAWAYVEAMHHHSRALLRDAQRETHGAVHGDASLWNAVPSADLAAREVIAMPLLDGQHLSTHWVAAGQVVVQIVLINAPSSERRVAAEIERVLRAASP